MRTMTTVEDFARTIGLSAEIIRDRGYQTNAEGWEHHAYVLQLTRTDTGATIETPWTQGLGINTSPTEVPWTVLHSMILDAQGADEDFETWAEDYGYDTDSRRAYATWEAVQSGTAELRTFLGDDYDTALELDES